MNISFLNTSFLWALPAILGPLAVHLFSRRKPRTIEFSDLRFIKLAAERVRTRVRLRKYLLLLIRTLIILLLVLSFAKPYLNSNAGPGGADKNEPLSAVILLDVSYSMGYYDGSKQRIETFKDAAKKMIGLLPSKSRVGIIAYSQNIEASTPVLSSDRAYLSRVIDDIKLSNMATDISCSAETAKILLRSASSSNTILIVLSDMAQHGFNSKNTFKLENTRVVYVEPAGGDNSWIENAGLDYDANARGFQINTEAIVSARSYPQYITAAYYSGDKKAGSDFIKRASEGVYRGSFFAGETDEDMFSGRVVAAPDRLAADNVFYFAGKKPDDYKIWIIDGDPKFGGVSSSSFYLRNVFPQAQVIAESGIDSARFSVPGAVILANISNDNPRITEFLKSGGGAVIFLGSHGSENFNPAYLPADIGSEFTGTESVRWAAGAHELQDLIDPASFDWGKIAVNRGFVLMPKEGATVLASLDSGRVFMVEGTFGRSRVVLCSSTADREWNNMPGRPLYAPFMTGLMRYVSGVDYKEERTSYTIGETYRKKAPAGTEIITPAGLRVKPSYDGTEIYFGDTNEPGIYRVYSGGKEISSFAVNLDRKSGEGDLTPVAKGALKEYFKGSAVIEMPASGWEKYFVSIVSGKDVTREALAVLFLLLLLEVLLANPKLNKDQRSNIKN